MDDRSQIIETTTRMAVLADRGEWDALASIFTDEVHVDYTSLSGGDPGTVRASDLISQWKGTLGQLAATQHLVSDHLVTVDAGAATATATFQATHVPHAPRTGRWVLGGDYRWELIREVGEWRISSVTMSFRWETGDRSILDPRSADASAIAVRFLERLGAMDIEGAMACFAEEGRQELPFAPEGFPTTLDGIAALRRQYGGLPDAYRSMEFPVEAVRPLADPEWVLLEYQGKITLASGGRYDNRYAGLFHVVNGKIRLFREYFDPIVLARAFAAPDALAATFNVEQSTD